MYKSRWAFALMFSAVATLGSVHARDVRGGA